MAPRLSDLTRTPARLATATAVGALALGALAAPVVAGASSAGHAHAHQHARHHAAHKNSSSAAYASVEKELSGLENPPSGVSLQETGSSLLYPVASVWAHHYKPIKVTTAATGSGTGIADAESGTVAIGASDAYLPPSAPKGMLNVPLDVSAQQIDYNVKGVAGKTHIHLNAKVLNGIYAGAITNWDAPAIRAINKGLKLPSEKIIPIHRSDGSGDTFLFTSYLDDGDSSGFVAKQGGPNTTVSWPSVSAALAEKGNGAMLAECHKTPGCVAYIGISYLRSALHEGLGDAALLNGGGRYVIPTPTNIEDEVKSFTKLPANGAISLIDGKNVKYGYPIVNFEYAILQKHQPSAKTAQAIRAFLAWGMDPRHGSATKYLAPFYFHPLAPGAMKLAVSLLKQVK